MPGGKKVGMNTMEGSKVIKSYMYGGMVKKTKKKFGKGGMVYKKGKCK